MKKELVTYKLYKINQIFLATYLGGPVSGFYLMSTNLKNLGNAQSAKKALLIGVLSSIVLFTGILFIPQAIIDVIPYFLIPTIYTVIIALYAQGLQGEIIKEHLDKGGEIYSGWKVFGIGILFLAISLIYVLVLVMVIPESVFS